MAVIGLGSIGTVYATHLISANHHNVVACTRTAVQSLRVEGEYGVVEVKPVCITDHRQAKPVDVVFLAAKSQDTPSVKPWLERLCGPQSILAILQNGVDHERRVEGMHAEATVVPTVVFTNGRKISPHVVRHLCPGKDLVLPDTAAGKNIAQIFSGTAIKANTSEDFVHVLWWKFLANLASNPLTAITLSPLEVMRKGPMAQLTLEILVEAAAVGRAAGVDLPGDIAESVREWMASYPGETGTSMLQDRIDGKPLEIDALTGTVVRLGEELGIPTPINRTIMAILTALSNEPQKKE